MEMANAVEALVQPVAVSVAVTLKLNTPVAVAVPLIAPFEARLSPVGNVPPVCAKVYGPVPPLAVKLWLYVVLNTPFGNAPLGLRVTVMVGQVTVRVAALVVAVPQAFVKTAWY